MREICFEWVSPFENLCLGLFSNRVYDEELKEEVPVLVIGFLVFAITIVFFDNE